VRNGLIKEVELSPRSGGFKPAPRERTVIDCFNTIIETQRVLAGEMCRRTQIFTRAFRR